MGCVKRAESAIKHPHSELNIHSFKNYFFKNIGPPDVIVCTAVGAESFSAEGPRGDLNDARLH